MLKCIGQQIFDSRDFIEEANEFYEHELDKFFDSIFDALFTVD